MARIEQLELLAADPIDVAALFVESRGHYFGVSGVDPWDEARDARIYAGPFPVIAHPPCSRWCKPLAKVNQTRYGHKIGSDGGCFAAALNAVFSWGGVLEHPAHSYAWDVEWFDLRKPTRGAWLKYGSYWVTEVSQSAYGHLARKKTWLLYSGNTTPPPLDWSDPPGTHLVSWLQRTSSAAPRIARRQADRTPLPFRDLLLSLARSAKL